METAMSSGKPSVAPLERAIQRLKEGLARYQSDTSDIQIRDGLIQCFKYTYEISHKTLKRYLEYSAANPELFDAMTFQELIRTGNEQGLLLGEWLDWRGYRNMRGAITHAYREDVSLEVVAGIPHFVEEVSCLSDRLRERLA